VWLVLDFIPVFCDDRMIGLSLLLPPLCCFDDQVEWMIKVQVLWLDHLVIWNIQTGLALLGVLKNVNWLALFGVLNRLLGIMKCSLANLLCLFM
jgi:hypothetical protein